MLLDRVGPISRYKKVYGAKALDHYLLYYEASKSEILLKVKKSNFSKKYKQFTSLNISINPELVKARTMLKRLKTFQCSKHVKD